MRITGIFDVFRKYFSIRDDYVPFVSRDGCGGMKTLEYMPKDFLEKYILQKETEERLKNAN